MKISLTLAFSVERAPKPEEPQFEHRDVETAHDRIPGPIYLGFQPQEDDPDDHAQPRC